MRSTTNRRRVAAVAAVLAGGLLLGACADSNGGGEGGSAGGTSPGEGHAECEQLVPFGDLSGRSVDVYTSIIAPEDTSQKESYELFTECTGAEVRYEGSKEFEAQLVVRVKSGNAPDVAYVPQPGLLRTLVEQTDAVVAAPQPVTDNVEEFFDPSWKEYGSVDGTFYAAPLGANVKSFVWYSPSQFADNGWTVPQTWEEMMSLSEEIAASGTKPWCAGIESGEATGWVLTDWLEDAVLRDAGPEVYDQWFTHEIAFDDPAIAESLDRVGSVLKDEAMVNGGIGDVTSIATTPFQEGGLPVLDGECAMHRQASFYAANWPEGTTVAEDGDVFAFYLPPTSEEFGRPVLGAGEFVVAFSDAPEVQAFRTYLSSDTWANEKARATPNGGWVSANKGLDVANLVSPLDRLSAEILLDPEAVFRFDASDLMPGAVGAGSFWTEMTAWLTGADTGSSLAAVEQSWPAS